MPPQYIFYHTPEQRKIPNCTKGKIEPQQVLSVYLTIIPRVRVGYEMVDSQRGA